METLTIKKSEAEILAMYKSGTRAEKHILEIVLGFNLFNRAIFDDLDEVEQAVLMAYHRLRRNAKEKRGEWTPDFNNSSQKKYYPFPRFDGSGFVVVDADCGWTLAHSDAVVGSRLCFPTAEMALEFFDENKEDYNFIFKN